METRGDTRMQGYADPGLCRELADRIRAALTGRLRFMEVCGTHTVSIYRSGLRSLLPPEVEHVSGPGCPVCVTHAREIAACIALARIPGVIVLTFGDMMRIPDSRGMSLQQAKARGADVRICYSPAEALQLARANPDQEVVFLGVGFETTAPAVAAVVKQAGQNGLDNLSLLSCHKRIPPALGHLLAGRDLDVDALLLPGHVSTVIGLGPYSFLGREFGIPSAVSGFEPADILMGLYSLVRQQEKQKPEVINAYPRAVKDQGNRAAQAVLEEVFDSGPAQWRGLGRIEDSGLYLAPEYSGLDAWKRFGLEDIEDREPPGCRCGEVLKGKLHPRQCPLFGAGCTPSRPAGPCMVSTEGSCAAVFKYGM
ncbi:hydrogenase formation protein HypD [Desulfovermiculus halophilus]|uniref:hydrogenase formation protein HypD n=1 Tax=Desulfovermiculus halophilus TaxID=339722 RepID=UPI001FCA12B2|nr:hydrogenase formation protein HypD [Desulfovermiculus halophilus]